MDGVVLGQKYKDTITGFEGIAIARITYLHSSGQVQLVPQVNEPSKYPDSQWLEIGRLVAAEV